MIKQIIEENKKLTKEVIQRNNASLLINSMIDSNGNFNIFNLKGKVPDELLDIFNKSIDKEKFKALIDNYKQSTEEKAVKNIIDESYGINFLGKSLGRVLARQQSTTIFVPDKRNEDDINKNSKNIYITADNLEALRHLRNSYAGKIKCIYIDPPYNTGSDGFCYPDKFEENIDSLKRKFSLDDNTAQAILDMTSNASNSHNAWLSFMYPRLLIAQELLKDDGIIFISIDDNEQSDAKLLCDLVFGDNSFIGTLIQQRAKGGGQAKYVVKGHDYILAYAKVLDEGINLTRKKVIQGKTVVIDGVECLRNDDVVRKTFGKYDKNNGDRRCYYEQLEEYKGKEKKKEIDKLIKEGKYKLELNDEGMHTIVEYIPIDDATSKLYSIIKALSEKGSEDVEKLNIPFSYPKPICLLTELFNAASSDETTNEIFMDFFSGSSSSAEAIMNINANDSKNIQYIMVQIAENLDISLERASTTKAKEIIKAQIELCDNLREKHIIPTVAKERIRRAAEFIQNETGKKIDYGFKAYELLDKGNTIDKLEKFKPEFFVPDEEIMSEFDAESLLVTFACDDGYGLTPNIEKIDLKGYKAYRVENKDFTEDVTLYLLNSNFEDEHNQALIKLSNERNLGISKIVIFGYAFNTRQLHIIDANRSQIGAKFGATVIKPIIKY